ncbi:hypothetical protein LJB91_00660, partial [Bacteroidales bacterium OttesenSCG-928-L03]|nr:hypothetical protein [Bacteroidales bacterium OttesenSCG-928-L03]
MKLLRTLILFILFCTLPLSIMGAASSFTTSYSYKQYTAEDGLPNMMINCLFQDSRGFIWLGTTTGLIRFDGLSFTPVLSGAEIAVVRITESPSGEIYAYTSQWLYVLDTEFNLREERQLSNDRIMRLPMSQALPHDYAYFENLSDMGRSLCRITEEGIEEINRPEGLNDWFTFKMPYWDRDNRRFLIPEESQVVVSDEEGKTLRTIPQGGILSFTASEDGLWAIGVDGIYRWAEDQPSLVYPYEFALGTGVFGTFNKKGELLIKDAVGIYRFDGKRMEVLYQGLVNPKDMLLDHEGNLWVSSYKGLYNFYQLQFKNYTLTDKEDIVRSVLTDDQDRLWAGSMNAQLLCIDKDGNPIKRIQLDPDGEYFYPFPSRQGKDLFFLCNGLLRVKDDKLRFLTDGYELYLFSAALPDGNLAARSNARLHILTPDGTLLRSWEREELGQSPRQFAIDRQGRLWVTGIEGLTRIKDDKATLIEQDSLRFSFLMTSAPDGNLWFNASDRIYEIVGDSIRLQYTFPGEKLNVLQFTRSGLLLVGVSNGLYLIHPEYPTPVFFGSDQGFRGGGLFETNIAEDSEGNVYLPTLEHLIRFNPENCFEDPALPLLHLSDKLCSSDNIHWSRMEGVHPALQYPARHVKFNYTGLCYSSP